MTGAEFIVNTIINMGVTDVFGIPGDVILEFLYELKKHPTEISVHLNYHEQMASFAAIGYAQSSGKLGVTYSTRGPGITNMMTAIAEAYYESIPVLFLTSHNTTTISSRRCTYEQEVNFAEQIRPFSKYSAQINSLDELLNIFPLACNKAVTGRKGPVYIDIMNSLFKQIITDSNLDYYNNSQDSSNIDNIIYNLKIAISQSKRPLLLIGDGVRHSDSEEEIMRFLDCTSIPALSSRCSQDLLSRSEKYFGYIGSHGIRYSNFILSKADLIISLGNRLAFPIESESFYPVTKNAQIIRIDLDSSELEKAIPNSKCYCSDLKKVVAHFSELLAYDFSQWFAVCSELKENLADEDITVNVNFVIFIMQCINGFKSIVCDVGNNEFWVSRAYEKIRPKSHTFYSKSFGTLGVALGKAIGTYYATKQPVIAFIGDQGFQYNIQELQYISQWQLPIAIVILNNYSSGMIRDKEMQKYGEAYHTTCETGYSLPDIKQIARAYGIDYICLSNRHTKNITILKPTIIEALLDKEEYLQPNLLKGEPCQNLSPFLDKSRFNYLESL